MDYNGLEQSRKPALHLGNGNSPLAANFLSPQAPVMNQAKHLSTIAVQELREMVNGPARGVRVPGVGGDALRGALRESGHA